VREGAPKLDEDRDQETAPRLKIASIGALGKSWAIAWMMPRAWRGAMMAADRRMDQGAGQRG